MDISRIRDDFEKLRQDTEGPKPVFLDNLSSTLKPRPVIEAILEYYTKRSAGARSTHSASVATRMMLDEARKKTAKLLNAENESQIIFTKSATEALNLAARGLDLKKGDAVITGNREHNANMAPWLSLVERRGIVHRVGDLSEGCRGLEGLLTENVKLVSLAHTSSVDGSMAGAKEVIDICHRKEIPVLLDATASVPRRPVDVKRLDVDLLAFSPDYMCGPNGIGVLYGRDDILERLKPLLEGGGSAKKVTYNSLERLGLPERLEAGGQNLASLCGLGACMDYIEKHGLANIQDHLLTLNKTLTTALSGLEDIKVLEPASAKLRDGVFNFNIEGLDCHDVAMMLEELGNIQVASGRLCSHSWFESAGLSGCVSISFYIYNTEEEVKLVAETLKEVLGEFS